MYLSCNGGLNQTKVQLDKVNSIVDTLYFK